MLETGKWGEEQAANYLINKGYTILARNYRHQKAEIDLIAQTGNWVVAVEVKTRTGKQLEEPFRAITKTKQRLLIKAINFYVRSWPVPVEVRMDAISVVQHQNDVVIQHVQDAFPAF
ncbi:MAG: YraN family protein [Bacteroidetes bacterium]|nr:YraN family protein [Bacteroidota bacterium]